ncbi:hypothetical protein BBJ28_00005922 [Nothophytophthora sp. Chile5]|nr:hypothetical protein BBJ28_00005922 [Nothophytophthora sp. Chile5]
MEAEHHLPRLVPPTPRGSVSSRPSVSSRVPLLDLAFHGDAVNPQRSLPYDMPSSRSRREEEYMPPNSSRVVSTNAASASLLRPTASWHVGNGSASSYEPAPQQLGLSDESAIMEASDPALFQAAVEEHARRLGVDPAQDAAFLWLARESLVAPLPDGWYHVTAAETGQPYYYSEISGESRWDHPSDDQFRQLFRELKLKQQQQGELFAFQAQEQRMAAYYDSTTSYQSGMAWQESEPNQQQHYTPQMQTAEAYYQDCEATETPYKTQQAQVYSPRGEEAESGDYAAPDTANPPVSRRQEASLRSDSQAQLTQQLKAIEQRKAKDDELLTEMQTEVANLKRRLSSRDEDLEAAKSEITQLQKKLSEYKQRLESNTKEHEDVLETNQSLKKELAQARSKMEGSSKEYEAVLETNQTLIEELALTKVKLEEIRLKQSGDADGVEGLQSQLASEQSSRVQQEQQLEQKTKQLSARTKELEAAKTSIRQLQEDLAKKRVTDMKEDEETAAAAADAAAATIKAVGEQLAEKETELEAERAHGHALQQEIVQLNMNQAATKENLKKLRAHAAEAEALRQELETVSASLTAAAEEKTALERQLEEQRTASAARLGEGEDQHRTLKREARALERELKNQQGLAKERDDEFAALKRLLESAEAKLATQAQAIQAARQQAFAEAEHAVRCGSPACFEEPVVTEIIRQAHEEKARVAELYTQEMLARRKLHNRLMELQGNIRVFCRVRPIQPVELKSEQSSLAVFFRENDHESLDLIVGGEVGDKGNHIGQKHAFEFDHVFQQDSTQEQVFEQTRALVVSALDGFNVCIFAYGQTGSGKTHTMEGPESDRGVNFRALRELFTIRDERMAAGNFECSLKLSILEVYNETIVDLLEGGGQAGGQPAAAAVAKGLDVRVGKTGVYVENLIDVEVFNEGDVLDLMKLGHSHRSVGSHDVNEHSSRSHLVLSITLETGFNGEARRRVSKLHLIDLAGSERVSKTAASGQRLKEAQNINRSLSALGDVIAALGASSKHVPYRNSKLTFLLQDSLSGNSKVLMFVNVSPVQWNAWETLCSLNFAARCRSVALGQAKAATATTSSSAPASGNGMHATMSMSAMTTSNGGNRAPPTSIRQPPTSAPKTMTNRPGNGP